MAPTLGPNQSSSGHVSTAQAAKSSPARHQLAGPQLPHTGSATNSYCLSLGSSAAFQQVKQTQASLARLSRVHQLQQQQQQQQQLIQSQNNPSSQSSSIATSSSSIKSTTFVDCLIRRFKDCFSEDFCTVPMFVVGNLSPGSDGEFSSLLTRPPSSSSPPSSWIHSGFMARPACVGSHGGASL